MNILHEIEHDIWILFWAACVFAIGAICGGAATLIFIAGRGLMQ
jgi:hypothetical protein